MTGLFVVRGGLKVVHVIPGRERSERTRNPAVRDFGSARKHAHPGMTSRETEVPEQSGFFVCVCRRAADPLWNLLDMTPEGRGGDWFPKVGY